MIIFIIMTLCNFSYFKELKKDKIMKIVHSDRANLLCGVKLVLFYQFLITREDILSLALNSLRLLLQT